MPSQQTQSWSVRGSVPPHSVQDPASLNRQSPKTVWCTRTRSADDVLDLSWKRKVEVIYLLTYLLLWNALCRIPRSSVDWCSHPGRAERKVADRQRRSNRWRNTGIHRQGHWPSVPISKDIWWTYSGLVDILWTTCSHVHNMRMAATLTSRCSGLSNPCSWSHVRHCTGQCQGRKTDKNVVGQRRRQFAGEWRQRNGGCHGSQRRRHRHLRADDSRQHYVLHNIQATAAVQSNIHQLLWAVSSHTVVIERAHKEYVATFFNHEQSKAMLVTTFDTGWLHSVTGQSPVQIRKQFRTLIEHHPFSALESVRDKRTCYSALLHKSHKKRHNLFSGLGRCRSVAYFSRVTQRKEMCREQMVCRILHLQIRHNRRQIQQWYLNT